MGEHSHSNLYTPIAKWNGPQVYPLEVGLSWVRGADTRIPFYVMGSPSVAAVSWRLWIWSPQSHLLFSLVDPYGWCFFISSCQVVLGLASFPCAWYSLSPCVFHLCVLISAWLSLDLVCWTISYPQFLLSHSCIHPSSRSARLHLHILE